MNKRKIIGFVLVIFGLYLAVGNTILSVLFNGGPISVGIPDGELIQLSPEDY
jgi:hypothetical protein